MRVVLALVAILAAAGCGSPAAQDEDYPRVRTAFCSDAAQTVRVLGRTYGAATFARSDVTETLRLSNALAADAVAFDSIPAVDTGIPDLAPAAKDLRERLGVVTGFLRGRGTVEEVAAASAEVLAAVTTIPRDGCRHSALDAAATRRSLRDVAAKIRCRATRRFLLAARRFGADTPAASSLRVQESADGFDTAVRLLGAAGQRGAVPLLGELAVTLHSWVGAQRFDLASLDGSGRVLDILAHHDLCA